MAGVHDFRQLDERRDAGEQIWNEASLREPTVPACGELTSRQQFSDRNGLIFPDLGAFRAVHATWHPEFIERLNGRSLDDAAFFLAASDKNSPEGGALEVLLKGVEVELPAGVGFTDHTGASRANIRARWWELPDSDMGYDGLVFPSNSAIPADPVRAEYFAQIPGYAMDAPPLFFGHYFKPADSPLRPERHNVACLDHGAAKEGPLVAYRWRGCGSIHPGGKADCGAIRDEHDGGGAPWLGASDSHLPGSGWSCG